MRSSHLGQDGGIAMGRVVSSRSADGEAVDSFDRPAESLARSSPAARRLAAHSRWRDPRMAAGVALVAVSVVIGSWVVAAADDRVTVWSAAHDLASGTELQADDLVQVPVRLDGASAYVGSDSAELVGSRLSRGVGAGELIAVSAVTTAHPDHRLITLPVEPMHAPVQMAHGDRVDVYVSPRDNSGTPGASRLVLASALVADASEASDSASGEAAVVLDVDSAQAAALVSASRSGVIDLVRVPVDAA